MAGPVDNTVNTVNEKLDNSGLFNTVTHDEVRDAVEAIQALPADEAAQVIDQLEQSGQLDRLAEEVTDGAWFGNGGLSADEREQFFADMAGKLDGQSLATLSNAFASHGGDDGGYQPVTELGSAIATHATSATKVDYIAALSTSPEVTEVSPRHDIGFGSTNSSYTDAEGVAIGEVLGTLRGTYAEDGFNALGDNLPSVLQSAVGENQFNAVTMNGSHLSVNWSADQYKNIMDAAASMGNADLKAQIFADGADTLRDVRDTSSNLGLSTFGKDDALQTMTDGLTAIIDSDTTGVMRELTYNSETMDGSAVGTYAREMLDQDRTDELGEQMARLQFGNGLNENAVERLNEVTTVPGTDQERRENAGTLGYFVGGVQAGAQSLTSSVEEQRAMTTAMLKSVLTVVDKTAFVTGPAALGVSTSAAVAKEWVQFGVNAAINDPTADAGIMLERAALPVDSSTGELGVGDNVASAFEDRLASVTRTAQP